MATALTTLLDTIWKRLIGENSPARSRFGLLQAASIDEDGAPSLRTVVLREVDPASGQVRFYTDARSPKIAQWRRDPRIALVGYDAERRTQLRMTGQVTFADNDARRAAWNALSQHNLIDYRGTVAPGTPLASVDGPEVMARSNKPTQRDLGYDNFCIVNVRLSSLDWLDLSDKQRHVRARFMHQEGHWQGEWIAP
ncbi:hypothetical protein JOE11_002929 [Robbsia andropogonis]|uniref:pyridoxamine 5'-phosphate oxidase family protein n=1 Tax=Robbsia andropogonis TaxID=28092 RepID=UPI00069720E7|nr:pyridoxamine 5'-phosphate oxidase family protein [Robbsia andropogonis]